MKLATLFVSFLLVTFVSFAQSPSVIVGAECPSEYFPLLINRRIAVLSNHTGMVGKEHIVDLLVKEKMNIVAIFSPEHGFRGNADAGEHVSNSRDKKTGIAICSLYDGDTGTPSNETMALFDILVMDMQDVGLRFYTYYITMVKLMDACAQANKKIIILDRPNPNGHYVDGPILNMQYKSGVGWLPIPIVHGMTLGEIALMTNGEKWLPKSRICDITVIKCKNYTHRTRYKLPIPPSPNLPNMRAIYLYPSLCLFEATPLSLGRGTPFPFQVYGHPLLKDYTFSFTPRSRQGAKNPPQLNKLCYGVDLRKKTNQEIVAQGFDLSYLIDAYQKLNLKEGFFTPFFEKLVGVDYIRTMILAGKSAEQIKEMWKKDVVYFKEQRKPYLLYKE